MKPQHERRVALCAPGVNVVVDQRGYIPVPDRQPEPDLLAVLQKQHAAEAERVLGEIRQIMEQGTKQVVDTLSRPVRPVFDKHGKIIAAQRVPTGD